MRKKLMTLARWRLAVYSTIAVAFLGGILAVGRPGFAQATLSQVGACTSPTENNYCTMPVATNPCSAVPGACFDYFRWFTNVINCADVPGKTVASGANGVKNGTDWTGCQAGSVPGYDCTMSEAECGTIDTYWGASCEEASFCGNVAMQACIGSTPYDCPGGGP